MKTRLVWATALPVLMVACSNGVSFFGSPPPSSPQATADADPQSADGNPVIPSTPVASVPKSKGSDDKVSPAAGNHMFYLTATSYLVKPMVNVALIVDDSSSMAEEQLLLREGIENLLANVRLDSFNLRFHLLTVTDTTADRAVYLYKDESGEEREHLTMPSTIIPFKMVVHKDLAPGISVRTHEFRSDMTDDEFSAAAAGLSDALANIPTSDTTEEKGLCVALRALHAEGSERIFNVGDKAAIIFVSDEDDHTSECIADTIDTYETVVYSVPTLEPCSGDDGCETNVYMYSMDYTDNRDRVDLSVDYTCQAWGIVDPDNELWGWVSRSGQSQWTCLDSTSPLCAGTAGDICNAQQTAALTQCEQNTTCVVAARNPYMGTERHLDLTVTQSGYDLGDRCSTPYSTYDSIPAYWQSIYAAPDYTVHPETCTRTWVRGVTSVGMTEKPQWEYRGKEQIDYISAPARDVFRNKADALFGRDGYFVSAIIRDSLVDPPASSRCPATSSPGNHFEYGSGYRSLAASTKENGSPIGSVHSICDADYSPALDRLQQFMSEATAGYGYKVDLKAGEKVIAVSVIHDGISRDLQMGNDVEIVGGSLNFKEGVLEKDDTIAVQIEEPVVPT